MKNLLFFILFFGLPHAQWIPRKLNVDPSVVPLGVVNLLLVLGVVLWGLGRGKGDFCHNGSRYFGMFLWIVFLWICVGILFGYDEKFFDILTIAKREISLMLLFYVPLAIIKNEKDFTLIFLITLAVHFLVGFEVFNSGVLGGANFNDSKRGSGPFAADFWGADVAGAYLAQVLMLFVAFLLIKEIKVKYKILVLFASAVVFSGILATYARGALAGCAGGLMFIMLVRGLRLKFLILPAILVCVSLIFLPQSIKTRFSATTDENGEMDDSTLGRFVYYRVALQIGLENPLGVGTGQVRAAMKKNMGKYVDPHNSFLFVFCEQGFIGIYFFLGMLFEIYVTSRNIFRSENLSLIYRGYALGMSGFVGALVFCNLFYANFFKELVIGTVVIHFGMLHAVSGLCGKCLMKEASESNRSDHPPYHARHGIGVGGRTALHGEKGNKRSEG